jgi:hypothetical protein
VLVVEEGGVTVDIVREEDQKKKGTFVLIGSDTI